MRESRHGHRRGPEAFRSYPEPSLIYAPGTFGKHSGLGIQALATPRGAGPATRPAVQCPVPPEANRAPHDRRQPPSDSTAEARLRRGFRIADWDVHPLQGVIDQGGHRVHIEPKVMDVLVCLARHPGEVVTREMLLDEVWKGVVVTDDVVTRCISELRTVLRDTGRDRRFIRTIPKRGYSLMVAVEAPGGSRGPAVPPDTGAGASAGADAGAASPGSPRASFPGPVARPAGHGRRHPGRAANGDDHPQPGALRPPRHRPDHRHRSWALP